MIRKSLISILLFSLIAIITLPVLASNITSSAENTLNSAREGFQNMMEDTGNSMERAKDGISNVINDGKNHIENGVRDLGNGAENVAGDLDRDGMSGGITDGTDDKGSDAMTGTTGDYTATRTSMTDTMNPGVTTTIWTVLAVTGIIIIALVWYYGSRVQNNNRDNY